MIQIKQQMNSSGSSIRIAEDLRRFGTPLAPESTGLGNLDHPMDTTNIVDNIFGRKLL